MRVHLLSVPNCPTDPATYPLDGFCHRTWLFAALLKRLGHEVIAYGVEGSTTPCDTQVVCVSQKEWKDFLGAVEYQNVPFEESSPLFLTFNTRAALHLRAIKGKGDIIATIGGSAQRFVAEHHPELRFLEYSIGYRGVTASYRVFQSHAWRHVVSGFTGVDGGRVFDGVIPPWFNVETFPTRAAEDYVIYCGRLVASKGIAAACRAAEEAGVRLVLVGHGDAKLVTYGDYLGPVPTEERNRLLAGARACLMPTQYCEPFGNVSAEAQLCGVPVLGPNLGGFTESIEHGMSGYRCVTLGEYVQGIDAARSLDRSAIRARAQRLYGCDAADAAYTGYFARLAVAPGAGADSLDFTLDATEAYGSAGSSRRVFA